MNALDRFRREAESTGGTGTELACIASGRNPSPLCMAAIAEVERAISAAAAEAVAAEREACARVADADKIVIRARRA